MSSRIDVVWTFEVAEDALASFVETVQQQLVAPARRIAGCERCVLLREHALPTRFALFETWTSALHLETHLVSAALSDALEAVRPLVLSSPQITRYVDAAAG